MSDTKAVKITAEDLARQRAAEAARRAKVERAFLAARDRGPPPVAVRADAERPLRTLALALMSAASFLPWGILAPNTRGQLGHLLGVLFLTLVPPLASARAERTFEAEETHGGRLAQRFSPLAVGATISLGTLFPWFLQWEVAFLALLVQAPLGLFLHVPRARACHLLVCGFGVLATTVLDDDALLGAGAAAAFALVAIALDHALFVRLSARGASRRTASTAVAGAAVFVLLGLGAFQLADELLPSMEKKLPVAKTVRLTREQTAERKQPVGRLLLALAAVVASLGAYHFVQQLLTKKKARPFVADPLPEKPPRVEPLEPDPRAATPWPDSPRRTIVERYLSHVAALAERGVVRRASDTPLDLVESLRARAPSLLEPARRLARAFQRARYSPEAIDPELAARAQEAAAEVERSEWDRPDVGEKLKG